MLCSASQQMLLDVHVHFIYLFSDCHGYVDFVRLLHQELCRLHLNESNCWNEKEFIVEFNCARFWNGLAKANSENLIENDELK